MFIIEFHSFVALNRYLRSPRAHKFIECPLPFSSTALLMSSEAKRQVLVPGQLEERTVLQGRVGVWVGLEPLGTHLSTFIRT